MAQITQLRPWGFAGAVYGDFTGKTAFVPAIVGGGAKRKLVKAKRRKFTFENGITVWAQDEATARAFAQPSLTLKSIPAAPKQQKPEPIAPSRSADVPAGTQAVPDPAIEQDRHVEELRALEIRRRRDALEAAKARQALADEAREAAEGARVLRQREEEAIIIQFLLMDEAA